MKKLLVIIPGILACGIFCRAADNPYPGILPDFTKYVIGLRYHHNSVYSRFDAGAATTLEKINTIELYGGWNVAKKIRVMGSVPYNFNERNNQGTVTLKNGIGDISFSSYYEILNKQRTTKSNKLLAQSLWFGVGIELPTGEYDPADNTASNERANLFQLGSGSIDVPFNIIYDIRLQDAGINISSLYKINTVNKDNYEYGNKFNIGTQAYYKFNLKNNCTIVPNAGVLFENWQQDLDKDVRAEASGGNLLSGVLGVEARFKRIAVGGNFEAPLYQDLGKGIINANSRYMVHISFAL